MALAMALSKLRQWLYPRSGWRSRANQTELIMAGWERGVKRRETAYKLLSHTEPRSHRRHIGGFSVPLCLCVSPHRSPPASPRPCARRSGFRPEAFPWVAWFRGERLDSRFRGIDERASPLSS